MLGLGLSLTVDDFRRIGRQPRAVVIALGCQLVLLPVVCFGLVLAFGLDPLLAVGMMLLAASPGGTTANLFSHLFRGDVALNITLTAVNSVIAVVTLPIVTNLAFAYFDPQVDGEVGLQFGKVVQVFAIVLIPVVIGMLVRSRNARLRRPDGPSRPHPLGGRADRRHRRHDPRRAGQRAGYLADVGLVALLFCLASLGIGYAVPARWPSSRVRPSRRRWRSACTTAPSRSPSPSASSTPSPRSPPPSTR